jgi:hypothetical protein
MLPGSVSTPAGPGVGDGKLLAGVVDEHLLAGAVVLAHDHVELPSPEPVALAELRVLVPFRLPILVLQPKELESERTLAVYAAAAGPMAGLRSVMWVYGADGETRSSRRP